MIDRVRVWEEEIKDLQRIINANERVLELERSPDKRAALLQEISDLESKTGRVRFKIEASRNT